VRSRARANFSAQGTAGNVRETEGVLHDGIIGTSVSSEPLPAPMCRPGFRSAGSGETQLPIKLQFRLSRVGHLFSPTKLSKSSVARSGDAARRSACATARLTFRVMHYSL